jgi:hypothetical protein
MRRAGTMHACGGMVLHRTRGAAAAPTVTTAVVATAVVAAAVVAAATCTCHRVKCFVVEQFALRTTNTRGSTHRSRDHTRRRRRRRRHSLRRRHGIRRRRRRRRRCRLAPPSRAFHSVSCAFVSSAPPIRWGHPTRQLVSYEPSMERLCAQRRPCHAAASATHLQVPPFQLLAVELFDAARRRSFVTEFDERKAAWLLACKRARCSGQRTGQPHLRCVCTLSPGTTTLPFPSCAVVRGGAL